nr:oxidoreductase C-terminal domain-containing protein [Microbacterium thalassium]
MLTGTAPARPEAAYVWSDQYDAKLQFAGELHGDEVALVEAGGVDHAELFVTYHRDGVPVAAFAVNQPRLMMRWRKTNRPALRTAAEAAA